MRPGNDLTWAQKKETLKDGKYVAHDLWARRTKLSLPLEAKTSAGRHKPLTISNWNRVVKVNHKLLRKTSKKKTFVGKKLGDTGETQHFSHSPTST